MIPILFLKFSLKNEEIFKVFPDYLLINKCDFDFDHCIFYRGNQWDVYFPCHETSIFDSCMAGFKQFPNDQFHVNPNFTSLQSNDCNWKLWYFIRNTYPLHTTINPAQIWFLKSMYGTSAQPGRVFVEVRYENVSTDGTGKLRWKSLSWFSCILGRFLYNRPLFIGAINGV